MLMEDGRIHAWGGSEGAGRRERMFVLVGVVAVPLLIVATVASIIIATCSPSKGRYQKYLLLKLVDLSINGWVGCRESIKLKEVIFSIQFFQFLSILSILSIKA